MTARENGLHLEFGWSEMEELLQCPVCFELPSSGMVEQCIFGHHICSACREQVDNCPFCKKNYQGTRNFVIEELMKNREYIKNVMELTAITQNTKPETVKEKKEKKEKPVKIIPLPKIMSTPEATKGLYPCGFRCDVKLPSCRLVNHVRSYHTNYFTEGSLNIANEYSTNWTFNCVVKKNTYTWQRALFVSGIGLLFFTYEVLPFGNLIMTVTMSAQWKLTQKYKAKIRVFNDRRQYTHIMKIVPTRYKMENILFNDACLLLDRNQINSVLTNKTIKCQLDLSPCSNDDVFGSSYNRTADLTVVAGYYHVKKL